MQSLAHTYIKTSNLHVDAGVTLEEYLIVNKREHLKTEGESMSEDDIHRLTLQYHCMDCNGDGSVDWWEFVKHQACKRLAKKPTVRETS